MKHLVATIALLAAAAGAAGVVAFQATSDPEVSRALAKQDAMEWLRVDFDLSEAQFTAIKKLHDAYSVVCEEHCREIMRAMRARNELKAAPQPKAAEIASADRRVEELRLVCESAIATHVRECAAQMSPEAGQRYLALILPKIKDFDHHAPPDLQLNKHGH
jgi:hypothetical protein